MRRFVVAVVLAVLSTSSVQARERPAEEIVLKCWAANSALWIIAREDGRSLTAHLSEDSARNWWSFGERRLGISPLDPRYTATRDEMLSAYRNHAPTYDTITELALDCGERLASAT